MSDYCQTFSDCEDCAYQAYCVWCENTYSCDVVSNSTFIQACNGTINEYVEDCSGFQSWLYNNWVWFTVICCLCFVVFVTLCVLCCAATCGCCGKKKKRAQQQAKEETEREANNRRLAATSSAPATQAQPGVQPMGPMGQPQQVQYATVFPVIPATVVPGMAPGMVVPEHTAGGAVPIYAAPVGGQAGAPVAYWPAMNGGQVPPGAIPIYAAATPELQQQAVAMQAAAMQAGAIQAQQMQAQQMQYGQPNMVVPRGGTSVAPTATEAAQAEATLNNINRQLELEKAKTSDLQDRVSWLNRAVQMQEQARGINVSPRRGDTTNAAITTTTTTTMNNPQIPASSSVNLTNPAEQQQQQHL